MCAAGRGRASDQLGGAAWCKRSVTRSASGHCATRQQPGRRCTGRCRAGLSSATATTQCGRCTYQTTRGPEGGRGIPGCGASGRSRRAHLQVGTATNSLCILRARPSALRLASWKRRFPGRRHPNAYRWPPGPEARGPRTEGLLQTRDLGGRGRLRNVSQGAVRRRGGARAGRDGKRKAVARSRQTGRQLWWEQAELAQEEERRRAQKTKSRLNHPLCNSTTPTQQGPNASGCKGFVKADMHAKHLIR